MKFLFFFPPFIHLMKFLLFFPPFIHLMKFLLLVMAAIFDGEWVYT